MSWLLLAGGKFVKVRAPWGDGSAAAWVEANRGRVVWSADVPADPAVTPGDQAGPSVRVFTVGDADPSDARVLFAAVIATGGTRLDSEPPGVVSGVILVEGFPGVAALADQIRRWLPGVTPGCH